MEASSAAFVPGQAFIPQEAYEGSDVYAEEFVPGSDQGYGEEYYGDGSEGYYDEAGNWIEAGGQGYYDEGAAYGEGQGDDGGAHVGYGDDGGGYTDAGGYGVPQNDSPWQEVSSVSCSVTNARPDPLAALATDPCQEMVWAATIGGRVTCFDAATMDRYVSCMLPPDPNDELHTQISPCALFVNEMGCIAVGKTRPEPHTHCIQMSDCCLIRVCCKR